MEQAVIEQCQYARNTSSECCDNIIGGDVCNDLMEFCYIDVCILAEDEAFIPIYILSQFTRVVNVLCTIPDIGIQQDPSNLLPYPTTTVPSISNSAEPSHTEGENRPSTEIDSIPNAESPDNFDGSSSYKRMLIFVISVFQLLL